jgi:hypothetical protein
MEVISKIKNSFSKVNSFFKKLKLVFVRENDVSQKKDINFTAFRNLAVIGVVLFVAVVFILPTEVPVEFTEKIEKAKSDEHSSSTNEQPSQASSAQNLWGPPINTMPLSGGAHEVNHNTSMIIGSSQNAKTQLRAGQRLALRLLDNVIVSQESVPVLAELILDSVTDSGLRLPAGTRFYGEASFQKGSDRAQIRFSQISMPNGKIRKIAANALSKDGQPGVIGRVFSDGAKNAAGQILTTFVGGLAQGSMETDLLGRSKGGIENGLLGAVAATAQSRAQSYGEKLKTEREWIELKTGTECDAVLSDSFKLQNGGDEYE